MNPRKTQEQLTHLYIQGEKQLKALNISKVFDLRSDTEIRKYNTPQPEIDGVEVLHIPVFRKEDYSPEMMAKYVRVAFSTCMFTYLM